MRVLVIGSSARNCAQLGEVEIAVPVAALGRNVVDLRLIRGSRTPESVFTMPGIGVQLRAETAFRMGRSAQIPRTPPSRAPTWQWRRRIGQQADLPCSAQTIGRVVARTQWQRDAPHPLRHLQRYVPAHLRRLHSHPSGSNASALTRHQRSSDLVARGINVRYAARSKLGMLPAAEHGSRIVKAAPGLNAVHRHARHGKRP